MGSKKHAMTAIQLFIQVTSWSGSETEITKVMIRYTMWKLLMELDYVDRNLREVISKGAGTSKC